ncbi:hypothetical protein, partial [Sporisorium scitamineum]
RQETETPSQQRVPQPLRLGPQFGLRFKESVMINSDEMKPQKGWCACADDRLQTLDMSIMIEERAKRETHLAQFHVIDVDQRVTSGMDLAYSPRTS